MNEAPFPKVSVLIPVFNREHLIAECIESVLHQSFDDWELVIVDNASSDRTWEICSEFAKVDSRIRLFRNKSNIGPVRNWAMCAQLARGSLAKVLFSDDCLERDCLSLMAEKLQNAEVGLVYSAVLLGDTRETSKVVFGQSHFRRIAREDFWRLVSTGAAPLSPGAVMLRASDLRRNLKVSIATATPRAYESHGAGPDVLVSLLTSLDYPYVVHVPKPLVFFRRHSGSISLSWNCDEVRQAYVSVIALFLRQFAKRGAWTYFVARSWLAGMRSGNATWRFRRFLISHEGTGSQIEILSGLACAALIVVSRLWSRIITGGQTA